VADQKKLSRDFKKTEKKLAKEKAAAAAMEVAAAAAKAQAKPTDVQVFPDFDSVDHQATIRGQTPKQAGTRRVRSSKK
jgi:hypothetical protein